MTSFATYNWEADEQWKQYLKRIDIVGNEKEIVEKAKRKYYLKYIDTNFENTGNPGSAPSPKPAPSSSTNTSSSQQNAGTNSSSSGSSAPSAPRPSTGGFRFRMAWLIAHVFLIFNAILYFIPFLGWAFTYECYMRTMYSGIAAYVISLVNVVGFPKFNREYANRLAINDNAHYVFISLSLLSSYPVTTMVFPMVIYSALGISVWANANSGSIPPQFQSVFTRFIQPYMNKLLQFKERALYYGAYFEVTSFVLVIINVFSGYSSVLTVLAFYWFLNFRYMSSSYSQSVFQMIGFQLDNLFHSPSCPSILRTIYTKIRTFLSNSVAARYQ